MPPVSFKRLLNILSFLLVIASAPFYIFPSRDIVPGLALLPLAWIVWYLMNRRPIPSTAMNPAILLFSGMVLVSTWTSYDLMLGIPKITQIVYGIALYFTLNVFGQTRRGWIYGLAGLVLCGVGFVILGLIGIRYDADLLGKIGFIRPVIVKMHLLADFLPNDQEAYNPNILAGSLLWTLFPAISLLWYLYDHVRRRFHLQSKVTLTILLHWIYVLIFGIFCASILIFFILMQSRSAYIGFLVTLFASLLLLVSIKFRRVSIILAILIVAAAAAATLLIKPDVLASVQSTQSDDLEGIDPALSLQTFKGRVEFWKFSIATIRDFPVTGVGMNNFRHSVFLLFPMPCRNAPCDSMHHVHNELLQTALELGIPGLVAFLSLYVISFRMLRELWCKAAYGVGKEFPLKAVVIGLGGGLFSHFLFGLTDAVFMTSKADFLFWILLALISGLYSQFAIPKPAQPQTAGSLAERSESFPLKR